VGSTVNPTLYLLSNGFYEMKTTKTFSLEIENIAKEKKISHMEAVLWFCNKQGIEPDTISSLISKSLKEKIEANARELNFLPRQAQLPI
jgi:hypothetical protein